MSTRERRRPWWESAFPADPLHRGSPSLLELRLLEALRHQEAQLVEMDKMLERREQVLMAEVSDEALVAECKRRGLEMVYRRNPGDMPTLQDVLRETRFNVEGTPGHAIASRRTLPSPTWRRFGEPVTTDRNPPLIDQRRFEEPGPAAYVEVGRVRFPGVVGDARHVVPSAERCTYTNSFNGVRCGAPCAPGYSTCSPCRALAGTQSTD